MKSSRLSSSCCFAVTGVKSLRWEMSQVDWRQKRRRDVLLSRKLHNRPLKNHLFRENRRPWTSNREVFSSSQKKVCFRRFRFAILARDASARCLRRRSAILINNVKQDLTIGVRIWWAEELCCKHYSDSFSERSSSRQVCRNVFYFKGLDFLAAK